MKSRAELKKEIMDKFSAVLVGGSETKPFFCKLEDGIEIYNCTLFLNENPGFGLYQIKDIQFTKLAGYDNYHKIYGSIKLEALDIDEYNKKVYEDWLQSDLSIRKILYVCPISGTKEEMSLKIFKTEKHKILCGDQFICRIASSNHMIDLGYSDILIDFIEKNSDEEIAESIRVINDTSIVGKFDLSSFLRNTETTECFWMAIDAIRDEIDFLDDSYDYNKMTQIVLRKVCYTPIELKEARDYFAKRSKLQKALEFFNEKVA